MDATKAHDTTVCSLLPAPSPCHLTKTDDWIAGGIDRVGTAVAVAMLKYN